jgi:predicted PurR-regulated permease PerM
MHFFCKKLSFISSKIITSILLVSMFVLIYFSIQVSIKNCMQAVSHDNGHTVQSILKSINNFKETAPVFITKKLPTTTSEMEPVINNFSNYINQHIIGFGGTSINLLFQTIFALIISISLIKKPSVNDSQMTKLLKFHFNNFIHSFKVLMGAQIYVAIWNAVWLLIYLFFILPAFDITLSYRKTLIIFTLFISLIPALGNMISNTVLLVLCLPFGLYTVLASLIFIVIIHKAEYLINAKIVGKQSHANIVEILLSLIIFELIFGLDGLILGPVTYAYVKGFLITEKIL